MVWWATRGGGTGPAQSVSKEASRSRTDRAKAASSAVCTNSPSAWARFPARVPGPSTAVWVPGWPASQIASQVKPGSSAGHSAIPAPASSSVSQASPAVGARAGRPRLSHSSRVISAASTAVRASSGLAANRSANARSPSASPR